jgi:hypothetical protein
MSRPDISRWQAQVSPSAWERRKREKLAGQIKGPSGGGLPGIAIVVEALVITGVLAALATLGWHEFAPEVFAEVTGNGFRVSIAEARREFGVEVWFAVVTAAAGVAAGTVLMLRHRADSVAVQVVLAGTGVLGALLVWQLGHGTGPGDLAARASLAEPGTMLEMPLDVASYANLAIWPIAAVIAGAAILAMRYRDASRDHEAGHIN